MLEHRLTPTSYEAFYMIVGVLTMDNLFLFIVDCDLMSLGNRCQAKLAKQGVTLLVSV